MFQLLITVLLLPLASLSMTTTTSVEAQSQTVPAMFVFGDSLVDVGNNNYLPVSFSKANFPHNGIDFPAKMPTGRFSNGKNSADWLAEKLGVASCPPYLSVDRKNGSALIGGVSFASGGALLLNRTIDQNPSQWINMAEQVSYYEAAYKQIVNESSIMEAQDRISKSIFVIVIGSNDIFRYSNSSSFLKQTTPPQQFTTLMALTLKDHLKKLYECGARKFVVAGVPPLGCTPKERIKSQTQECNEGGNSMAIMYNQNVKSVLGDLIIKSQLFNASYSYLDTFTLVQDFFQRPAYYGFREVKEACCGLGKLRSEVPCTPISLCCENRSDHVFWDFVHPTEAAARILIDSFFDPPAAANNTFPINLRQLLAV